MEQHRSIVFRILLLSAVVMILTVHSMNTSNASELDSLKEAAEQGDAEAQFKLGLMYHLGESVSQEYTEAVRWFRLAAEQGQPEAQNILGVMYDPGKGVRQPTVTVRGGTVAQAI